VPCGAFQYRRYCLENFISRRVPKGIVKRLEPVHVEQQDRKGTLIPLALFKEDRQLLVKRAMVFQSGEPVGCRFGGEANV